MESERLACPNWIEALKVLGRDGQLASPNEADDMVRRLHAVLCIAPIKIEEIFAAQCDEKTLDRILEVGATESAARRILDGKINYLLSKQVNDDAMAVVSIPGHLDREQTAAGSCETTAFVAAVSFALANVAINLSSAAEEGLAIH